MSGIFSDSARQQARARVDVPPLAFVAPPAADPFEVDPRDVFPLSPDCRDLKCAPCVGDAWDDEADDLTGCVCSCHETEPDA